MEFKFGHRPYQEDAVNSVINLFKGQPIADKKLEISVSQDFKDNNINSLAVSNETILMNLREVQKKNNRSKAPIDISKELSELDFAVEMETGTGKTFVYFSTIAKLSREYNWRKFIIIVPSVPIKEGVESEFRRLKNSLENIADKTINFNVYDSSKINELQEYYREPNCLEILLMTMGSFNKDDNILNRGNPDSKLGGKPVDLLANTRPIVILDEPQKMLGEATTNKLKNFNPLFVLRYSATHKVTNDSNFKFVYRYTPLDAYRDRYVKKIEVLSVYDTENNPAKAFLKVKEINAGNQLTAKISYFENTANGIKERTKKLKDKADLYELSNEMPEYKNYVITGISASRNEVKFRNGLVVKLNEVTQNKDDLMKIQIKETIRTHLEKEKDLNPKGIKVLTLFFIDKVVNYRNSNDVDGKGKIRKWFEEFYNELTCEEEFKEFATDNVNEIQAAYFSVDKNGNYKDTREKSQTNADVKVYDLIMNKKEELVSFTTKERFIFSHSALREGWDNPNVFQLCNLNETTNEVRRRQEVGRGLRLPVNQDGDRIMDDDINILTVASSVSYELFAKRLQEEITSETGVSTGEIRISNAFKRKKSYIKMDNFNNEYFKRLWQTINKKMSYTIQVDEEVIVEEIINKIKVSGFKVDPLAYQVQKTQMINIYDATINKEIKETRSGDEIKVSKIPNVVKRIADFTGLTKKVVIKIISKSEIQKYIFVQPDIFVEKLSEIIKEEMPKIFKKGITYYCTEEMYELNLFNNFIMVYEDSINPLIAHNLDLSRTFYEVIQLDSETEVKLINEMNADKKRFKFFVKLPAKFYVPTPTGNYNPDWAIVFQDEQNDLEVYLVRESKKTAGKYFSKDNLRDTEVQKIEYGKKAFDSIKVDYQVVQTIADIKAGQGVFNFTDIEKNFEEILNEEKDDSDSIKAIKGLKKINSKVEYLDAKAALGEIMANITEEQFNSINNE
ncbi:restriction endonuclease [Enterococcus sp. BWR-S5]|uniref:restriction endonuclease n=1 Tax=Enterococcus sp. BWR-S5 TaxID=2787714 RepID=UPI0019235147|nr:DEAD/DEAH box helicase family protein [Enterococcus sp. BWR-S5]MBL1225209.1 DEAD/DEAH box helicase family protein [Enterococcus sp. BWR-S5]